MASRKSWLPTSRVKILAMSRAFLVQLASFESDWGVPPAKVAALNTLTIAAAAALALTQDTGSRSKNISGACKDAFDALEAAMRDMKNRCFFMPPITPEQWRAMLLPEPDEVKTPVPSPNAQATAEVLGVNKHMVHLKFRLETGSLSDDQRSEYGYSLWWGVLNTDETIPEVERLRNGYVTRVPQGPVELHCHRFTRRKEITLDLPYTDSGRSIYFVIQFENDKGDIGPWGPIFAAIVP